jgi:hypothetical protein
VKPLATLTWSFVVKDGATVEDLVFAVQPSCTALFKSVVDKHAQVYEWFVTWKE